MTRFDPAAWYIRAKAAGLNPQVLVWRCGRQDFFPGVPESGQRDAAVEMLLLAVDDPRNRRVVQDWLLKNGRAFVTHRTFAEAYPDGTPVPQPENRPQ